MARTINLFTNKTNENIKFEFKSKTRKINLLEIFFFLETNCIFQTALVLFVCINDDLPSILPFMQTTFLTKSITEKHTNRSIR